MTNSVAAWEDRHLVYVINKDTFAVSALNMKVYQTHRLLSPFRERFKSPGNSETSGVDGNLAVKRALEANICPVHRFNISRCVDTHSCDRQNPCSIRAEVYSLCELRNDEILDRKNALISLRSLL